MSIGTPQGPPVRADFSLDDRFSVEDGEIYLTTMQALVRVLIDQQRADRRADLNTGGFVSGYPGSPVGGLDLELARRRDLLDQHRIVFVPGLNEDLAATAVFGSQTVAGTPGANVDGVYSMWYGKAPGVDRSGDAFRHANIRGTSAHGGLLAVAGDDPDARSSMLPTDSNQAFYDWSMPILFPGSVQDVLDLGLHGYALSRASGLAIGFKIVTNVADGAGSTLVGRDRISPIIPTVEYGGRPFLPRVRVNEAGPPMRDAEREMALARLRLASAYIQLNRLNPVVVDPVDARIGLIAGGSTYFELRRALERMQLDDAALASAGIRLLKLGALFPLDEEEIRSFARGLHEIVVVEDKRPFVEMFVKDILYGQADAPAVIGKRTPDGLEFLPPQGELTADVIWRPLARRLAAKWSVEAASTALESGATRTPVQLTLTAARTAFFCSGCPHNTSLQAPAGAMVGAGIGCHIMALTMPRPEYGDVTGYTQMGGEGTQWIGMAPFTDTPHMFQNLGDGTFHHSGSLAIRAAIAAKVNITYKLLYNSAVGMTGGQDVEGAMPVPELTRMLAAEGVRRIIVTTDDPKKYRRVRLAAGTTVRHRDKIMQVQDELARTPGVTVLIHDQQCAAEKRRLRKRARQPEPTVRLHINERVCEGCGDCGQKSQCLSVQPTDTEFGRKTKIHQASCNLDYSCLSGDCPSFVSVETKNAKPAVPLGLAVPLPPIPAPATAPDSKVFSVHMTGIGGTGVVTMSQILATAATLQGKLVRDLDLTGSSQKAGPVVSQLQLFAKGATPAATIGAGEADLVLGFDILTAVQPANLEKASAERTVAVVSTSRTPTGRMSVDPSIPFPDVAELVSTLSATTRPDAHVFVDASAIAESLFNTHMVANTVLVGAALQAGVLPLSVESVQEAIRLNGTAVEANLAALGWGRVAVADPTALPTNDGAAHARSEQAQRMVGELHVDGELDQVLQIRVAELIAFQNARYARQYLDAVKQAREKSRRAGVDDVAATAFARYLFKLMAYKDEYEVARLHLASAADAAIKNQFGTGAKVYWNLHPPVLRAMGMDRKIKLGPWFKPAFQTLVAMRKLRGTALDVFGYAEVRRVERALIDQYSAMMAVAFEHLNPENAELVTELAETPDLIRGYEGVKLGNVRTYLARIDDLARMLAVDTFVDGRLAAVTAPSGPAPADTTGELGA
jgi:indolepyruvate ferredoxin oxidoreductase